ncbi:molybdenum cofactor sulfurase [Desulfoluna limicola]|uniref:Molybdenum cofactor sulfurase n=1 Tax=Desulfoluna limicola TaxID=2810562 RepID=A0ABM7PMB7_9BACT|nr:MOSC domain-containing protein [Desulfoluna limicola]BCS98664.1 molybdenum cofactor sulfurase [Desulfoluna limicola]
MSDVNQTGKVVSLAVSTKKGIPKTCVEQVVVVENHGVEGDAHAGPWHRQVSLLAQEGIQTMVDKGLTVGFGDFAENIATEGIDWLKVPVGTRVAIGGDVVIEITQIGKTCHKPCAIFHRAGDCIMPREGIFGKVVKGGTLRVGDSIDVGSE